jgi:hypothetical protein
LLGRSRLTRQCQKHERGRAREEAQPSLPHYRPSRSTAHPAPRVLSHPGKAWPFCGRGSMRP